MPRMRALLAVPPTPLRRPRLRPCCLFLPCCRLPVSIATLKVAELREHLLWRGLALTGNKPKLAERLQKAVNERMPMRTPEQMSAGGVTAETQQESGPKVKWEKVDSSKIDRPVYTGPEKFTPNPALGWTPDTHPFSYMDGA